MKKEWRVISPLGSRTIMSVYIEETILSLERFYINGGKRGFLVEIHPEVLTRVLKAVPVRAAIERQV